MTITTNLFPRNRERDFSRRPATSTHEAILQIAAGAALAGLGIWRRRWLGAALGAGGGYLMYSGISDFRRPYQGSVRVGFTNRQRPPADIRLR